MYRPRPVIWKLTRCLSGFKCAGGRVHVEDSHLDVVDEHSEPVALSFEAASGEPGAKGHGGRAGGLVGRPAKPAAMGHELVDQLPWPWATAGRSAERTGPTSRGAPPANGSTESPRGPTDRRGPDYVGWDSVPTGSGQSPNRPLSAWPRGRAVRPRSPCPATASACSKIARLSKSPASAAVIWLRK